MQWYEQFNSILSNPTVSSLAESLIPKGKPAPAPSVPTPVIAVANPVTAPQGFSFAGMSMNNMLMIGGGVLAVVVVLIFSFKKK